MKKIALSLGILLSFALISSCQFIDDMKSLSNEIEGSSNKYKENEKKWKPKGDTYHFVYHWEGTGEKLSPKIPITQPNLKLVVKYEPTEEEIRENYCDGDEVRYGLEGQVGIQSHYAMKINPKNIAIDSTFIFHDGFNDFDPNTPTQIDMWTMADGKWSIDVYELK